MSDDVPVWVYVAGPYTGGDVAENVRRAVLVALDLREAGIVPVVPHLSHFAHYLSPRPYEFWMSWDFDLLDRCDMMLRLSGESPGADREAERFHGPVVHDVETAIDLAADFKATMMDMER